MSTAKAIGKGIVWGTTASVVGKCVVLFNIFLILRTLSVYEYGLSELVFSTISVMSIILLPGLSTVILSDISLERAQNNHAKMRSVFRQFFLLNLILSVLAWSVLFFGSSYAAQLAGNGTIEYFLKIVSFTFLVSPFRMAAQLLAGFELRFFDQSFYSVVEELFKAFLLCIFLLFLHLAIDGLLFAVVLSQVLAVLVFTPRTIRAYRRMGTQTTDDVEPIWKLLGSHRKWGIASSYVSNITQAAQVWLIRLVLGTEAVGLFAFASGIVSQVSSFQPLSSVLSPILPAYIKKKQEFSALIRTSIKFQLAFGLVLVVLGYIGLPVLIYIFPKYAAAVPLTQILLLTVVVSGVAALFNPVFSAMQRQIVLLYSGILKLVLTFILFTISMLVFGIPGIGYASIIIFIIIITERIWRLKREIPDFTFSISDLYTFSSDEKRYIKLLLNIVTKKWSWLPSKYENRSH
ncbi:oligosaccharide flippase family protein [Patescibacteria group bacterium]|nr:oligosaccharide flippase family protein [Patescibacteria group bacterium]